MRRPRESGDAAAFVERHWGPAFAGTTISRMPASRSFATKQTSIHADVNPYRRQSDGSGDSGRWLRRDIGAVEIVMRRRVHLIALDFPAHRLEANRVSHRDPRRFFLDDDLRLLVELGAVGLLRSLRGLDDQVLEWLVAPARAIAAALHRLATQQRHEEVIGAAVVAGPAEHHHRILAALGAL